MAGRMKNPTPPPIINGHDEDAGTAAPEIEVIDEGATGEDGVDTVVSADPGVESLQQQLDAERARAAAAEAEAERLRTERSRDQQTLTDSRLLVIESTINTKEAEKADIKRQLREAKEAGDYEAEVEAQDKLSELNIELRTAKLGKDRLEQEIEGAKANPEPANEDERLEQWFQANNVGQASRKWLREHREYLTDPILNAELTRAHFVALKAGHQPNSPAYFETVESELFPDDGGGRQANPEPAPAPRRAAPAPAAPVSRGADAGGGREVVPGVMQTGQGKYLLLNNEAGRKVREAAEMSGVTLGEYIEEARKLKRGPDGQLH